MDRCSIKKGKHPSLTPCSCWFCSAFNKQKMTAGFGFGGGGGERCDTVRARSQRSRRIEFIVVKKGT